MSLEDQVYVYLRDDRPDLAAQAVEAEAARLEESARECEADRLPASFAAERRRHAATLWRWAADLRRRQ